MSSAPRRGLGRGLEVLIGGGESGGTQLAHLPVDAIHANPRQPRRRFEPEATTGLAELDQAAGAAPAGRRAPAAGGGYELIAGERRWRAAREAGIETLPALVREADDRDTLLLALVENVAREQLSPVEEARAYAVARGRVRALARRRRRAGRPLEAVGLEPAAPARAARGGALDGRARRADRGPRPRGARASRPRRAQEAREADRPRRHVGPGAPRRRRRTAAPPAGRASTPSVDPALAERARGAAERLTGLPARVSAGKLEIHFGEELRLEELVEVLESL